MNFKKYVETTSSWIAIPYICFFFPLNWKEFSLSISLSISMRKRVGIGGLLLWKRKLGTDDVIRCDNMGVKTQNREYLCK